MTCQNPNYFVGQIRIPGRPRTMNDAERAHWRANATHRKTEREQAFVLWRKHLGVARQLPQGLVVSVQVRTQNKIVQDTGAAMPLVKAAIDGLIDGKWIPDDTPDWIAAITFKAPTTGHDSDDTLITIHAPTRQ